MHDDIEFDRSAFPQTILDDGDVRHYPEDFGLGGMTIRQWFAGQALAGGCNPSNALRHADELLELEHDSADHILNERINRPYAERAEQQADAEPADDEVERLREVERTQDAEIERLQKWNNGLRAAVEEERAKRADADRKLAELRNYHNAELLRLKTIAANDGLKLDQYAAEIEHLKEQLRDKLSLCDDRCEIIERQARDINALDAKKLQLARVVRQMRQRLTALVGELTDAIAVDDE